MNRRSFLGAILKAGVAAAVLPSALTYARKWKAAASGVIVPSAVIDLPVGPRYHAITLHYRFSDTPPIELFTTLPEIRVKVAGKVIRYE